VLHECFASCWPFVPYACRFLVLKFHSEPQTSAPTAKKLKIYISVDMEGVAGVVTADQLGPTGFEYERFRQS